MSPSSSSFAARRTACLVGLLSVLLLCVYHNTSDEGPLVVARETSSTSTSSSAISRSRWTQSTTASVATTKTGLPTNLPLSDINVVVLTDVHSWIGGHGAKEGEALDADYGDVLSFVQILKEQMLYANNPGPFPGDLWFVMNGDWIDGTGLAMNGDATKLVQLLEKMPWDAVNIGNHELYHNSVISTMTQIGGFAEWWGSRYLTSNVVHSSTDPTERRPIGNHYRILKGHHANVLTFGFLFNMQDADSLVTVEQVQSVVQSAWFKAALQEPDIDAILVLAHMDVQDPLVAVILNAIRQQDGMNDMPVQFITGHTHQRAHDTCDHLCSSFEAGRYLDTVGFVSFPKKDNVAALLRSATAATQANSGGGGGSPSSGTSGGGGSGYDGTSNGGGGGGSGYGGTSNGSPSNGGTSNGGTGYGGPTGSTGGNTDNTGGTEDTTGYTGGTDEDDSNPPGGRALVDRILQTTPSDGGDGVTWPVAQNDGDTAFPPMGGDADDSDNTNPNPVDATGSDPTNTPDTGDADPNTAANPYDGSTTAAPGSNSPNSSGTGTDTVPAPAPAPAVAPPTPVPVDLLFHHIFINASKQALRERLGVSSLETDDGVELSKFINRVQTEMGLKEIVGCTPQSYYLNHGLHQQDSLWRLFRDGVVPRVFSTRHPRAVLFLGKGGLRYDLLAGDVAMDEVIAVSPFNETMYVWKDIPGPVIAKLNKTLNFISTETSPDANSIIPGTMTGSSTMVNRSIHRDLPELPEYILAPAKQPFIVDNINITYDLIIDQFEMKFVQEELNKLYPAGGNALPYPQHTTTSMWLEYFTGGSQDCNIQGTKKGSSGHHSSYRPGGGSGSGEATEADIMHIWMAFIAVLVVILMGVIYARQRGASFQAAMRERQQATFDAVREYENENNNINYTDEEASSDDDFDAEFV